MKSQHDERQQWINYRISHHALVLLMFMILFNSIFKSTGAGPWAEPMSETMILIGITSGFYVTRSLFKDAYISKKDSFRKNTISFGFISALFLGVFFLGMIEPLSREFITDGKLSNDLVMLIGGVFFFYLFLLHIIKRLVATDE